MKTSRAIALSLALFTGVAMGFFPRPLFGDDQQRVKNSSGTPASNVTGLKAKPIRAST